VNYKQISLLLGKYLFFFSLVLFIPLGVALYYDFLANPIHYPQPHSSLAFFFTILISFALSFLFLLIGRSSKSSLGRKEGILLVVLIWLFSCWVGSFPFLFSKTLSSPIDAYFETMSGFTTTGSSIFHPKNYDNEGREIPIRYQNPTIPNKTYVFYGTISPVRNPQTNEILYNGVEAVSRGVVFWRSFIQWLGGMGIVLLFLAIFPTLAVGGKFLYNMEMPGPIKDTLAPRIKETSSILWKLYLGLTILQIYMLIWTNANMPLFDAFCIAFSALSTGGFSITNYSIGSYNNFHTEWVVILFMFLGSINFSFYFHLIRRKLYQIYEPDFLFFLMTILLGGFAVSLGLIGTPRQSLQGLSQGVYTLGTALRDGFFQAVSSQTTTGFSTTNFDIWPYAPQLFLLLLMFIGGMAGSTAGGIKTSRFYILFKIIRHKLEEIFRPEKVLKLKISGKEIDQKTEMTVLVFFAIAVLISTLGLCFLVLDGVDTSSAIGVIACMINNIGLGFKAGGPLESFAFLSPLSKIVSIVWMLLGRLEFFAVLLLFVPSFWKTSKN
jgi:trk system potassium uptake protein